MVVVLVAMATRVWSRRNISGVTISYIHQVTLTLYVEAYDVHTKMKSPEMSDVGSESRIYNLHQDDKAVNIGFREDQEDPMFTALPSWCLKSE